MAIRIISAAVAIPIGILILLLDNKFLLVTVIAALSVVATYEILLATKYLKNKVISAVSLSFVLVIPYIINYYEIRKFILVIASAFVLALFLIMIFMHKSVTFEEIAVVATVSVGIPAALNCLALMRSLSAEHGQFYIVFALVSAWVGDGGAYFIGTFFGKHKMAPEISPKKSWEGFFGGIIVSGLFGLLLGVGYEFIEYLAMGQHTFVTNKPLLVIVALCCSVLGVIGDFSASIVKRGCSVKDFGSILPGHGGVLDRFDSVLFVAPFVYITFMINPPFIML